jgi:YidC/Oxa1 family membrane protein insertase
MEGERTVDAALVERYRDKLDLRTLADFHSPSSLGSFANAIWWTDLVIAFTNLMHWLLASIHGLIGSWAVSIVVLTVMVRLLLLYPSRKQTQMNLRMMEVQKKLAPQLEELKKRYGDDVTGFNQEKMRLMMRNGINPMAPLGGCALLIFQMPVMMGLYFCLQESIFFRLEHFLWIDNLSAPDMTQWWSERIPFVSTPDNLGSTFYLGPYLNILPLLAVALMLWQQHKMMPPATDDQTRQQQQVMKFMMVFMAVMFYKVASGLALYFIVGTLWGIMERRFFTKPQGTDVQVSTAAGPSPTSSNGPNGKYAPEPEQPKGALGRFKEAVQKRLEEAQRQAEEQSRRQIRNKPDPRQDRKKKRRK